MTLRPSHYELIEGQLHLMRQAADEGVAARYMYQLEGVLLALCKTEDISQATAEALRRHIHGQLRRPGRHGQRAMSAL